MLAAFAAILTIAAMMGHLKTVLLSGMINAVEFYFIISFIQ
jgi:hypothetical protein